MALEDEWGDFASSIGIAVAIVIGLLTLCVGVILVYFRGRVEQSRSHRSDQIYVQDDSKIVPPPSRAARVKNRQPKKNTPLSHPLLATDFKGHTGAVLSLGFELGGKYVASCSDGVC